MTNTQLKVIYYAMLECAMRYKEAFRQHDLDGYNAMLTTQAEAFAKEKKLTPTKERKVMDRIKGMSLSYEQKLTKFSNLAQEELATLKKDFNADERFDAYATGYGLLCEEYIIAKSTADLIHLAKAYNQGLLDELLQKIKEPEMGGYPNES